MRNTIAFDNTSGRGAEVEKVKPFCMLTKNMDVPTWQDIVGDFADKRKPGLAGRKFSCLCGFTFKPKNPNAPYKYFQIVYVPKLKGSLSRNDKALSGWYCWTVPSVVNRQVTSIQDMKRMFNFDVNKFFHCDLFEKYLKMFKANVSYALAHQVNQLVRSMNGKPEYNELVRHVNAVKDSLDMIDDVQQTVTPETKYNDQNAPEYAQGSAPKVGNAKIAYNADKTYGLRNLDKQKQHEELLRRAAAQKDATVADDGQDDVQLNQEPNETPPIEKKKKSGGRVTFDPSLRFKFGREHDRMPDEEIFDKYDDYDNDDYK